MVVSTMNELKLVDGIHRMILPGANH